MKQLIELLQIHRAAAYGDEFRAEAEGVELAAGSLQRVQQCPHARFDVPLASGGINFSSRSLAVQFRVEQHPHRIVRVRLQHRFEFHPRLLRRTVQREMRDPKDADEFAHFGGQGVD